MSTREQTPFSALLLRYRAAAHLTQEQLAARAGLSVDAIAALERGKRRTPRGATVELLAEALGLDDAACAEFLAAARSSSEAFGASAAGRASHTHEANTAEATAADAAEDAARTRRPTRGWSLPAELTPLVGRVDELDTILQRLTVEGVRLLTLTGPAGVGKTRLALAAAARLAEDSDRFPNGVIFADLTPVRDPALVLTSLADAVGLLDVGSRPVLDRLAEALAERQLLVVLDNVEQVLPAAASPLAELLAACAGLQVLVTSRMPLRLRWEQTLRVPPLAVPDPSAPVPPLQELAAIPSVALFVQRARAHRADFALSEQQAPLVAELVAQLDGLPLALELAAARMDVLSLPVLARWLGDRLRLLASGAPDRPERQRSLEAAVSWSYDLLSEAEQCLFRCLGVFAGRVSLDAITAVASAVGPAAGDGEARARREAGRMLPQLLPLAEKSLLLPVRPAGLAWQQGGGEETAEDEEDVEPAFGMLETVRVYAEERLAAAGELETARRSHAHYFAALAERADVELRGPDQRAWYLRLERELDNLRAALRWLLDQDDLAERERALRLAAALGWFWTFRGYHAEGVRWLEEALDRAPAGGQGSGADLAARTRALLAAGGLLNLQGAFAQARAVLAEGLTLAERRRDPVAVATALAYLGNSAVFVREAAEAARLLHEAQRRWEALGDAQGLGQTLFYLGYAADAAGDVRAAAAHYTAALEQLDVAGDLQFAGIGHSYLGVAAWKCAELPRAVEHIQEGVRTSVALRNRWFLSFPAQAAAALVGAHAEPAARARLLGAADALAQATGATFAWEWMPAGQEVARLRERLARGEGKWADAYWVGRALPFGKVAALALRLLEEAAQALRQPEVGEAGVGAPLERGPLTEREAEVLRLVAQGRSSKEIGRRLFLSASTVNQHVKSIFHKLGVDTRAQAVAVAAQRGLL